MHARTVCYLGLCGLLLAASARGQPPAGRGQASQEPGPTITVRGHTFTQLSLFRRNIGGPDDMTTPFPPHKIIDNIYYVGTKSLAAFLVVTPEGHILINSTYERNVPAIQKSVEQLGFKFSDIKILLGSHAHGDHQEGDALVRQLTGAQVMAMAEDVPALRAMRPGGKEHPIDRVLHDGARRHDARRVSDGGAHSWLHDLDAAGAGGRETLRRGHHRQLRHESGFHAGEQHGGARDRGGVQPRVQGRARPAVRRAARIAPGHVQPGREVREARERRTEPLHRSGGLQAGSRHRRGDVPRGACRADEEQPEMTPGQQPSSLGACLSNRNTLLVGRLRRQKRQ